jgi:hypothetical protein
VRHSRAQSLCCAIAIVKAQCGFDYWALPVSHPSKWLSNGAARDVRAAINAAFADLPTDLRSNPIYRSVNLFIERPISAFFLPLCVLLLAGRFYLWLCSMRAKHAPAFSPGRAWSPRSRWRHERGREGLYAPLCRTNGSRRIPSKNLGVLQCSKLPPGPTHQFGYPRIHLRKEPLALRVANTSRQVPRKGHETLGAGSGASCPGRSEEPISLRMRPSSWTIDLAFMAPPRRIAGQAATLAAVPPVDNQPHTWAGSSQASYSTRSPSSAIVGVQRRTHSEAQMAILTFLKDKAFDPEDVKLMGEAFDHVCRVLRLTRQNGDARSTAAVLIIEAMARGERNPSKLAYAAIRELDKCPTGMH